VDIDMQSIILISIETSLLFLLETQSWLLSDFMARKICHVGSGILMLLLNPEKLLDKVYVLLVCFFSIAMTWQLMPCLRPFRFGKAKDLGITLYLIFVSIWFIGEFSL